MAQPERSGHGSNGCRREPGRRQLLRRHESHLCDGLELRGEHVLRSRVREATWRYRQRNMGGPRGRHLLRSSDEWQLQAQHQQSSSFLRVTRNLRFGAVLRGTSRCSTQTGEAGGVGLAKNWATADGCTWQIPTKVTSGTHVCTKMAGCKSGYPVEFCSFNGDHTPFPDTGQSQGSWGPPEVWKFFSQF